VGIGRCYYSHHKIAVGAEKAFQTTKISSFKWKTFCWQYQFGKLKIAHQQHSAVKRETATSYLLQNVLHSLGHHAYHKIPAAHILISRVGAFEKAQETETTWTVNWLHFSDNKIGCDLRGGQNYSIIVMWSTSCIETITAWEVIALITLTTVEPV
jgi:hypothetical protein